MELNEFVKETIVDIVKGINDANDELKESSAFVVSSNCKDFSGNIRYTEDSQGLRHYVSLIDFDVAVSISDGNSKEGKGRIQVGPLSWGRNNEKTTEEANSNRVKFSIPLALPREPYKSPK